MDQELRLEIEETIRGILVSDMRVNPALLDGDPSSIHLAGRGIGLDSIEMMGLVLGLEETFDIYIDDAELTTALFETIDTLTDFIWRKAVEEQNHSAKEESR